VHVAFDQRARDQPPAVHQDEEDDLNGSEMITGGSIIMPMDIRIEATAMSMIRNGTNSRKPISPARFSSESMNAGASVESAIWSGDAAGFACAMSMKSLRSASRT
jgi:hypothetical protein